MDLNNSILRTVLGLLLLSAFIVAQNFQQNPQFNQPMQPNMPQNPTFNQPSQPNSPTMFNQPTGNQQNTNFQQPPQTGQAGFQPGSQNTQQGQVASGTNADYDLEEPELTQEQQSQITCAQAGRTAVSQCFQQNGGFQMMTVIALLSNGTQGQLPQNPEQVKQTLCQSHSQIVACIFSGISRFNGTQQCSTVAAFIRLEQETVGLLNGVQQMCGKGLMPKAAACMQRLNYDMMQCYDEAGLKADLYSPRGSRMEGAIIGDNREIARTFCSKRKELHACQNRVLNNCEGAKLLQELSGNDLTSSQAGIDILCNDIDVYVSGLVCFQTPPQKVETCANDLIRQMTDVTIKQIRDDLNADAFFREYCKVRISNLKCDSNAWDESCERVAVGLKTEYQCNLLPAKCKNDPSLSEDYKTACGEKNFARELRQGSGASSVLTGISSVLTVTVAVLLIMLSNVLIYV